MMMAGMSVNIGVREMHLIDTISSTFDPYIYMDKAYISESIVLTRLIFAR